MYDISFRFSAELPESRWPGDDPISREADALENDAGTEIARLLSQIVAHNPLVDPDQILAIASANFYTGRL